MGHRCHSRIARGPSDRPAEDRRPERSSGYYTRGPTSSPLLRQSIALAPRAGFATTGAPHDASERRPLVPRTRRPDASVKGFVLMRRLFKSSGGLDDQRRRDVVTPRAMNPAHGVTTPAPILPTED
jgi:hypothetical protein